MRPELQEIADEASRVLRADVTLEDRDFILIAYSIQSLDVDLVRRASILRRASTHDIRARFERFGIADQPAPLRIPADPSAGIRSRLCLPARYRSVTYGYLWALDETTEVTEPAVARAMRLADRAGAYLAQQHREHEDNAAAVRDLLSADVDAVERSANRIADRGLIARSTPVAAIMISAHGADVPGNLALNLVALPRHALAHVSPPHITVIVPVRSDQQPDSAVEAAALVRDLFAIALPDRWPGQLVAGIGEECADLGHVRDSFLHARLAARVATAVPTLQPIAKWANLGIYRLIAAAPVRELAGLLLEPAVQRLLELPDQTLAHTVLTYLDHAGDIKTTAAHLHVHRQTLYARLERAEKLTGLSFASGHDRLRLHTGLLLAPLLQTGHSD